MAQRLIDAQDAFNVLTDYYHHHTSAQHLALQDALNKVPTADLVNEWCTDCKEYDKAQHCCHRFTKVIRQAQEELKQNAVPVIRCKDCKHRDKETANCTRFRKDWYVQSNSFCSWAEPRVTE